MTLQLEEPRSSSADWEAIEQRLAALERRADQAPDPNRLNLLVFSGDRDRLLAAFVVANGAAACGLEVSMFFTFWATAALRNGRGQIGRKSLVERCFGWMLPNGLRRSRLSQMDMCGIGRMLMAREMRRKNIADLDELAKTAGELGVTIRVCDMSMQLMGIRREELIEFPQMEMCGVASFIDQVATANTTLMF